MTVASFGRRVVQALVAAVTAAGIVWVADGRLGSAGQLSPEELRKQFAKRSAESEAKGLAEPFKGVTTDGRVVPDLFAIRSTGVSTEPVRRAADAFLKALDPAQREKTTFAIDDPEWRKWMNQHFYVRQGVGFDEMSEPQRKAAFALLEASLSAKGLKLSRDIMRLNHTLGELNNNDFVQYGQWLYWITVMGTPSATEPWGWQIDGHHLIINYFVLGDQVVMTPAFFGSEPITATSGEFKGVEILQDEQGRGLAFVNALSEAQRAKAILEVSKTGNHNVGEAFRDNVVLDYAGIRASELQPAQRDTRRTRLIGETQVGLHPFLAITRAGVGHLCRHADAIDRAAQSMK